MQVPALVDTTLRDGEQAPGVSFTISEKITIAKMLDRFGIEIIEAGTPAMGNIEQESLKAINRLGLKARVTSWNRLLLADIRASLACGVRDLHISAPVSDLHIQAKLGRSRQWVLDCLTRAIRYALDYGCRISVGAEDASRADFSFLLEFALLAQEMGAKRLRYADTVGVLHPFSTRRQVAMLVAQLAIPVEFHGHNDFGMALANSLAASAAGAAYVSTTVGGLGERAGNASLEGVYKLFTGNCQSSASIDEKQKQLEELSLFVSQAARRPTPAPWVCKNEHAGASMIAI